MKEEEYDKLYLAVADFIEKRGGKAVVVGGIQFQQFPEDNKYNYRIAIKFTGTLPKNIKWQTCTIE